MDKKQKALRQGVIVFVVLAVLTGIEYEMGILGAPAGLLFLVAILKAASVVIYFMHVRRVLRPGEGDHS